MRTSAERRGKGSRGAASCESPLRYRARETLAASRDPHLSSASLREGGGRSVLVVDTIAKTWCAFSVLRTRSMQSPVSPPSGAWCASARGWCRSSVSLRARRRERERSRSGVPHIAESRRSAPFSSPPDGARPEPSSLKAYRASSPRRSSHRHSDWVRPPRWRCRRTITRMRTTRVMSRLETGRTRSSPPRATHALRRLHP